MEAFAIPEARSRVQAAVAALVDESIDGVPTHALGADLIDIRRSIDRLEAEFVRRLHRFHSDRGALADGGGSTVSWLRSRCAMTVKAAAYRVHLARTLGALPATLDSARFGRASFSNVTMIAHLAEDVGVAQVAPLEGILVGAAETLDPGAMRTLTQAARLRLDPDGVLGDDNHAHERRWFECEQTYGGVFVLRGELDAEGGALVKTAIDALSQGRSRGETTHRPVPPRKATSLPSGDHTGHAISPGPVGRLTRMSGCDGSPESLSSTTTTARSETGHRPRLFVTMPEPGLTVCEPLSVR